MSDDKQAYFRSAFAQISDKSKPALQRTLTEIQHPGFREACKKRQVPEVPEPAWHKPRDEQFYVTDDHGNKRPNIEFLRNHLLREGRLTEEQALYILTEAKNMLSNEPNLLSVTGPITVVGDIHGQYYDLMKVFEIGGDAASNTYLFLGDYVDRGSFGIEALLYIYALKIWHPDRIYLIRGNHECRHLTEYFTFHRECTRKYSLAVYTACIESFSALPLAAVLDRRFFCVHGGISPELNTLADINKVDRFVEPPAHGLICDLLWADPYPVFDVDPPKSTTGEAPESFLPNPTRGCSYFYTYEAVCNFLERNSLLGVIRGHEVQQQGYQMYRKTRSKKFPSVITVFSAPNYCDFYHNRGAVLKYVDKNITIRQFNASSHPYWLPNFMDAFTWSLPFVGDKIVQMLLGVLSVCTAEELEESSEDEEQTRALAKAEEEAARKQRREAIRNKILAVGRMQRIFQVLRDEAENASELNSAMEASGIAAMRARGANAPDELGVRGNQIKRVIRSFDDARRSDLTNERMPEFHVPDGSAFPNLQAPSTRPRSPSGISMDDRELEEKFRKAVQENDDEAERELRELADKLARVRGSASSSRPGGGPPAR